MMWKWLVMLVGLMGFSSFAAAGECNIWLSDTMRSSFEAHEKLSRVRSGGAAMWRAEQADGAVISIGSTNPVAIEVLGNIFAAVVFQWPIKEFFPAKLGGFTAVTDTDPPLTAYVRLASGPTLDDAQPLRYGRIVGWFQCTGD